MSDKVAIFDTTLRDGEQSPGIALTIDSKVAIAEQLARLAVDVIEAGFPVNSRGEFEAVAAIAAQVQGPTIAALARAVPADIERAWEALQKAKRPRIHTFIATSPIHIEKKLRISPEEVVRCAADAVRRARSVCADVEFSAEDATRSEPGFLAAVVRAALEAGATVINLPDTVGWAVPEEYAAMIRGLYERVPELRNVTVSVHCHNDLGLAVANSLAGVGAGARQIECAMNGIGERAGNCALEEVVMAIRTRKDRLQVDHGVNTRELARTSRLVSAMTGYVVPPNKAIVGANAFAHESGIHQDGVLKYRQTYEIMDPRDIGDVESQIVLGKHSGRHAFIREIERMGFTLTPEKLERAFARFKALAEVKGAVSERDLEALISDEARRRENDNYTFVGLEVHSGTHVVPTATVTLQRGATELRGTGQGDGPVAAACAAIAAATGTQARLLSFHVSAITGGVDALGDVTVVLLVDGARVTGRAVSTDIVEASARAYVDALNKYGLGEIDIQQSIEPYFGEGKDRVAEA